MNEVDILNQFEIIDRKLDSLIDKYATAKETNLKLEDRISQLELELKKKTETVDQVRQEKALIKDRVDGLLSRLGDMDN